LKPVNLSMNYRYWIMEKLQFSIGSALLLFSLLLLKPALTAQITIGQNTTIAQNSIDDLFSDIILRIDTFEFSWQTDRIRIRDVYHLAFEYQRSNSVVELFLYPKATAGITQIALQSSGDYGMIDTLVLENRTYFRTKLRFANITETDFLRLRLEVFRVADPLSLKLDIPLFPHTPTQVKFYPTVDELFLGEEKIFELVTNNVSNIKADGIWISRSGLSYRITKEDERLRIHILGTSVGSRFLNIEVPLIKPILGAERIPVYKVSIPNVPFIVKQSPLAFLTLDQKEVILDDEARRGIEVQIDYDRGMVMEKTYRIEAQEYPGGALIAEIFTRNRLSNGKVLCWLRVFNFHRRAEGYLYIKEGDESRFLTNFDILPQTVINKVSILREGKDYTDNLSIYPGETIEVRIEGVSLDRADFRFEELSEVYKDTLLRSENISRFKLKVPSNISKKSLSLYNAGKPTGYTLSVKEFQRARPLDFIMLSYEENGIKKNATFNKINSSILYPSSLKDIIINPMPQKIDDDQYIYGKQFLKIKITLTNAQRQLVEMRTVENFVICPDQSSPRFLYYQGKDCQNGSLNLNSILSIKTNELDDWSRVEIEISHQADKHNEESFSHRVEFILARRYNFDIDVSFPAGLLQIRPGRASGEQLGSFSGVSLAALAQFSFFKPGKIAQYQPYRVGVGTIAMNAFDFSSESADRGLALVALGSLSPTRRDPKIRLTLYFGGGYFLTNADNLRSPPGWFLLIGPGIAVRI